jgi:tetratricopeptide (TPR) repeat protein
MSKVEVFQKFIQQKPNDPMPRYALGMELKNLGQLEASVTAFQELIQLHPDHASAYQQCGLVLVQLGKTEEAKSMYQQGIEAATRKQDWHTKSELEAFLDEIS